MKVVVPFVCIGLADIEGSVEILAKFSEMFDWVLVGGKNDIMEWENCVAWGVSLDSEQLPYVSVSYIVGGKSNEWKDSLVH